MELNVIIMAISFGVKPNLWFVNKLNTVSYADSPNAKTKTMIKAIK